MYKVSVRRWKGMRPSGFFTQVGRGPACSVVVTIADGETPRRWVRSSEPSVRRSDTSSWRSTVDGWVRNGDVRRDGLVALGMVILAILSSSSSANLRCQYGGRAEAISRMAARWSSVNSVRSSHVDVGADVAHRSPATWPAISCSLYAEAKGVTKDNGASADILWGQILRRITELGTPGVRYAP